MPPAPPVTEPRAIVVRAARQIALATAMALLTAAGCAAPQSKTTADASTLPEFSATEAALFDDNIGLGVFGSELEEASPAADLKLAERVSSADAVLAVLVSTVTRDTGGHVQSFQIVLTPEGAPLAGAAEREPISLDVSEHSPTYPFLVSADAALVGQRLILFLRRYNDHGRATVHFRLEADSHELRKAISDARALEDVAR